MNLLVIGDSHIPQRAKEVPEKIRDKINEITEKELFDHTFFTGDLVQCPGFINYLNLKTKKNLFIVVGNMDYFEENRDMPLYQKLDVLLTEQKLTIGLTHGAQVEPRGDHAQLENLAIEKSYNILISGHTHREEVFLTKKGILLINPGSVTGAWSFVASKNPTFIVLRVNENSKEIQVSLFQLNAQIGEIKESKLHFVFKEYKIQNNF